MRSRKHDVFQASRVQHVSDLHPKFALRPHHVWKYGVCRSMVDIQCPTAEIRRGNKKRRKKKPQDENHSEPEKKRGSIFLIITLANLNRFL